jgi:hypothetical protein
MYNKWGGLMVKELISFLGVQGLIFTNDMGCDKCWNVDKIFFTYVINLN